MTDTVDLLPFDVAILMYHYVRPPDAPHRFGAGSVDLESFARQLDDLSRHRTIVGWNEVREALSGGATLSPDSCVLTFDDGHDDHHRYVLPMLSERDLPAIFFVLARDPSDGLTVAHRIHVLLAVLDVEQLRDAVTDELSRSDRAAFEAAETSVVRPRFEDPVDDLKWVMQRDLEHACGPVLSRLIERLVGPEDEIAAALHLDERQIVDIAKAGMTLGGHTRHHRWLDHISPDAARAEILSSARQLERLAPEGDWPFAYPFGGAPPQPAKLLAPAGFGAAFVATGSGRSDRFLLGRVDAEVLGSEPTSFLSARARGVHSRTGPSR